MLCEAVPCPAERRFSGMAFLIGTSRAAVLKSGALVRLGGWEADIADLCSHELLFATLRFKIEWYYRASGRREGRQHLSYSIA